MKEQIIKLRASGLSYPEIAKEVGCTKSTVSYYCGQGVKEKSIQRTIDRRKNYGRYEVSFDSKVYNRINNFIRRTYRDLPIILDRKIYVEHVLNITNCYITGKSIDIYDLDSWSIDHIIPVSKGGGCEVANMGISLRTVNYSKHDMLMSEYIQLCKEVCENNGYVVNSNI